MLQKDLALRWTLVFLFLGTHLLLAQSGNSPLNQATAAYQQNKTAEAEQILETILRSHPDDVAALMLMGVVLDREERYGDAEVYYQRALKIAPASAQLSNDLGNHYLLIGDQTRAREMYVKTIALDAHHVNANLQLAQMSVEDRQGLLALGYLNHVGADASSEPGILLLRARALALCGRCVEAKSILAKFAKQPSDAAIQFSTGTAWADCRLYGAAEQSFSLALDADPQNFEILYNLGLAALRAEHIERARDVLEIAAKQRPDDADALYALAQVFAKSGQPVQSAALLVKGEKAAPQRSDIVLQLAQVSGQLGFYEDSAAAYDRYLELKPNDDIARRERGFQLAQAHIVRSALRDLEWYLARHPQDPVGHFEIAIAEIFEDRSKALLSLNRALELDPTLYQARYTRGVLKIENGKPQEAVSDLEAFLAKEPRNFRALAHLGQAYLALNRTNDALGVLERARALAPDSALVLVYYHRALEKLGRRQEATAVLAHLKECGGRDEDSKRHVGLVNYLSLSPAGQRARYLADLREHSSADPNNVRLKISLATELLNQGKKDEALAIFQHLFPSPLDAALMARCGRILLDFDLFNEAQPFLKSAVSSAPGLSEARLDFATALFHVEGPDAALEELNKTPIEDRKGDYYLLRAQILDALGKVDEAATALNQGMHTAPTRAGLYYQATGFLLKHKFYREAEDLLAQASRVLPDDRDLLLAQAVTLNLLRRNTDSEKLLDQIQARWPEWDRVYLLKGILLEIALKPAEARQTLETAIALGANTAETYYYEALAITKSAPEDLDTAQNAIEHALALTSDDPYIYLLAGKISLARKEYAAAIERLLSATRLDPTLIPAHYELRHAYNALGDVQKSQAELETIKHLASETGGSDESPFSMEDFLFSVRRPG